MISQITGKLISKKTTEVVIECSGVGFLLIVPISTEKCLPALNEIVTLQTLLITNEREDTIVLFGFYTDAEREIFKLLLKVKGIGPKSALGILSSISISEFCNAIKNENHELLKKMPGIGDKTAKLIVIELKNKITKIDEDSSLYFEEDVLSILQEDAINALITLGYNKIIAAKEVKKAISALGQLDITIENIINLVLKKNKI